MVVLEFTVQIGLVLKSQTSSCLCLPSTRIKGKHHHTLPGPVLYGAGESGLDPQAFEGSILSAEPQPWPLPPHLGEAKGDYPFSKSLIVFKNNIKSAAKSCVLCQAQPCQTNSYSSRLPRALRRDSEERKEKDSLSSLCIRDS